MRFIGMFFFSVIVILCGSLIGVASAWYVYGLWPNWHMWILFVTIGGISSVLSGVCKQQAAKY